jgi:hypothetical protein
MEYTSLPDQLSSFGRIVIVSPMHRKCPGVVVVAAHKIPERCKQATAQAKGGDGFGESARVAEAADRAMPSP